MARVRSGHVSKVVGLTVESQGPPAALSAKRARSQRAMAKETLAEVVGFRDGRVLLMPWEQLEGISAGASVRSTGCPLQIPVGNEVLGRILDPLGRPLDDLGPARRPKSRQEQHCPRCPESLPPWTDQARRSPPVVRVMDAFTTCGRGQRSRHFRRLRRGQEQSARHDQPA